MKRLMAIFLVPLIMFTSCSDEEDPTQDPKPTLPPASSMAPDFDSFSDTSNSGGREAEITNWAYAAVSVGVYSGILYSNLVVPVTAFELATNQEATFDTETELWVWEYDITVPAKGSFHVELTADVEGSDVDWKGHISQEGSFSDFVWFEGESNLSGEAGNWVLYEHPETPAAWLSSQWSQSSTSTSIIFTIEKSGEHEGSYIKYETDNELEMDRSVVISDTNASSMIYVDWNSANGSGQVKSQDYYENDLYHCWDHTFNDVQCE